MFGFVLKRIIDPLSWLERSRKRFAYPTREEAWQNFLKRKERELQILAARKGVVEDILEDTKEY